MSIFSSLDSPTSLKMLSSILGFLIEGGQCKLSVETLVACFSEPVLGGARRRTYFLFFRKPELALLRMRINPIDKETIQRRPQTRTP